MLKGLLVGAGVFLAGLVLGVVLLGQGGTGVSAGPEITVPTTFHDTVDFKSEITLSNCGTRTSVVIPAISGVLSQSADSGIATSVTVTGLAAGDMVIASWTPGHATGTLQDMGLSISANASTTNNATVFLKNYAANTSTVSQVAGTLKVCYFD